jgi:magnesium transporter
MAELDTDARLCAAFLASHPNEAGRVLETLTPAAVGPLLDAVDRDVAAAVVQRMVAGRAAACLERLGARRAARIVQLLPLDAAALILRCLPEATGSEIVAALPRAAGGPLERLMRYPDGTAGASMDPKIFVVPNDVNVRDAARRLRRNPRSALYYVYVVDRALRLVGVLTLRELMLAGRDTPLVSVMHGNPITIGPLASHRELIDHGGWHRFHALPVVDSEGVLLGVVRYEAMRKIEEQLRPAVHNGALDLAVSLSELYVRGLNGIVSGLAPSATAASSAVADAMVDAVRATTGAPGPSGPDEEER